MGEIRQSCAYLAHPLLRLLLVASSEHDAGVVERRRVRAGRPAGDIDLGRADLGASESAEDGESIDAAQRVGAGSTDLTHGGVGAGVHHSVCTDLADIGACRAGTDGRRGDSTDEEDTAFGDEPGLGGHDMISPCSVELACRAWLPHRHASCSHIHCGLLCIYAQKSTVKPIKSC